LYYEFTKEYEGKLGNLNEELDLKKIVSIISDLKGNYSLVNNKVIHAEYLYNKIAYLLQMSKAIVGEQLSYNDIEYKSFVKLLDEIINSLFIDSNSRLYAKYNVFNCMYNNYSKIVDSSLQKDILKNQMDIYNFLNYKYGHQIITMCEKQGVTSDKGVPDYDFKSKWECIKVSSNLIDFLSRDANEFKNSLVKGGHFIHNNMKLEKLNKTMSESDLRMINKYKQFFNVPDLTNKD
jgi:hypothetical protein